MPVSARERGSSRYNGRKHSGRGAWKKIEGIPLQATIVQPKTYLIMKARVYLSLGALLLFLAPLGCSDKAESPAPETPPEEQPTPEPEPEKPEFVDANMSMEELMKTEDPDRNYRLVSYRDDTCAMYSFFDPMTELQRGTPRDQLQWVSEKVDGNSVRWTYRITNGDHDEAVRQTLERWAEKEDEEE